MKGFGITVGAFLVIGCSVWFINKYFGVEAHAIAVRIWPPPTAKTIETRQLRRRAGWFSLNCGHVRHHEDADAAISCAANALTARKPFFVSFDFVGIDSTGIIGIAANSNQEVFQVTTDQLGWGAFGMIATSGPVQTVTVNRCENQPIEEMSYPANRYLICRAAQGK